MRAASLAGLALAASALACSELEPVERDRCGNGVIEPGRGEDCDRDDPGCGAPGTAVECRLLCGPAVAGEPACPGGGACGLDGVCHAPGQVFTVSADLRWTARSLLVGDTTADGYPELVGVSDEAIVAHLGAPDATYAAAVSVPNLAVFDEPRMSDVNGDGAEDLTIPVGFGLYSLVGHPFSVLQPTFQNSFPVPSTGRVVATSIDYLVDDGPGPLPGAVPTSETLAALRVTMGANCPLPGGCEALLLGDTGAALPAGQGLDRLEGDDLPWTLVPGTATPQFVTALAFADDPQTAPDEGGVYLYRGGPAAQPPTLTAMGAAPVVGSVRGRAWFADVDGDGLDDLLVAVRSSRSQGVSVAWGLGAGAFSAAAFLIGGGGFDVDGQDPLAWGDLTGDGRADFVSTTGIVINQCVGRTCSFGNAVVGDRAWIDARIGDVDGDGRGDAIAFGLDATTADVLRATAHPAVWNDAPIPAPGVIKALRTGDFDGSGTADVALVTTVAGVEASDELHVAFGTRGGAPAVPTLMGHVGSHVAIDASTAQLPGRFDDVDDLLVVADRGGERGAAVVLGSTSQRMIAPLLPVGDGDADLAVVEGIVSLPLDGDATADVICLITEYTVDRAAESVVRVFTASIDGSLTERTPAAGIELATQQFILRSARWIALPARDSAPAYVIGADLGGRVAAIPITCGGGTCTAGPLQDLTGATRGGEPTGLHADDLDGDGDLDLYASFRPIVGDAGGASTSHVRVWTNAGGFAAPIELAAPDGVALADVAALDLDLDGRRELAALARAADPGVAGLLLARADAGGGYGALAPAALVDDGADLAGGLSLVSRDLSGDGLPDLALVFGVERTAPQNLKVLVQREAPGALAGR